MQDNMCCESRGILENIRALHAHFQLSGSPRNSVLSIPDDLLLYLLSLLRGEASRLPDSTVAQWNELLHALNAHWILPLLYYRIKHGRKGPMPPEEIDASPRTAYYNSLARSITTGRQIDQMDPEQLPRLILPIIEGKADYTKGNRLISKDFRKGMSRWRSFGNFILTMLTKIASGYWHAVFITLMGLQFLIFAMLFDMQADRSYP